MSDTTIATAQIDIIVNTKELQSQFNQTRSSLNTNAGLISKNFHKSFNQITSLGLKTARTLQGAFKAITAPAILAGGIAVKKYMASTGGMAANKEWKQTLETMNAAMARIGGMIWQSKFFGKTIQDWTKYAADFVNTLKDADLQKLIDGFEKITVAMVALKGLTTLVPLVKSLEGLIYALSALTGAKGLETVGNIFKKPGNIIYNMGGKASRGMTSGTSRGMATLPTLTTLDIGKMTGSEAMGKLGMGGAAGAGAAGIGTKIMAKLMPFLKFMGKLSIWVVSLEAVVGLITGLFPKLKINGAIGILKNLMISLGWLFKQLFMLIELPFKAAKFVGKGIRKPFELLTNTRASNSLNDRLDRLNANGLTPEGQAIYDQKGNIDEKTAKQYTEYFSKLLDAERNVIDNARAEVLKQQDIVNNSPNTLQVETAKQALSSLNEDIDRSANAFAQNLDDLKEIMSRSSEEFQKSQAFQDLGKFIEDGTKSLSRASGRSIEEINAMKKRSDQVSEILKVRSDYARQEDENYNEQVKILTETASSILKAGQDMAKGLGYTGQTVGLTEGATFAGKVNVDWQTRLIDYNIQIAEINAEGNKKMDEQNTTLTKLYNIAAAIEKYIAAGMSTDAATSVAVSY